MSRSATRREVRQRRRRRARRRLAAVVAALTVAAGAVVWAPAALAQAELTITPDSHDYGAVFVGDSSPGETFSVDNVGTDPADALAVTIVGPDADQFAVADDGCTGETLDPTDSCQIVVAFEPTASGVHAATLQVDYDDAGTPGSTTAELTGTGVVAELQITPDTHDFGEVIVGQTSAPETFTVENTGDVDVQVTGVDLAGTDPAQFAVGDDTCTLTLLAPEQTCAVDVVFGPDASEPFAAVLDVEGDIGDPVQAALSGTGILEGVLVFDPPSHDFGAVAVGDTSPVVTFTLSNDGNTDVAITGVTLTGADADRFAITGGDCLAPLAGLAPGEDCTVEVTFEPDALGGFAAVLEVANDGAVDPATAALTGDGVEPADLVADPVAVDFGTILVDTTSDPATVTITNVGDLPAQLDAAALSGASADQFVIDDDGCEEATLGPDQDCGVVVRYAPDTLGDAEATLVVTNDTGVPVEVPLSGRAAAEPVPSITPPGFDFGEVEIGDASTHTFEVSNDGEVGLEIGDVDVVEPVAAADVDASAWDGFSIVDEDCTGTVLDPEASCAVTVAFEPLLPGPATALLLVDADTPAFAELTGTGVDAPAAPAPTPAPTPEPTPTPPAAAPGPSADPAAAHDEPRELPMTGAGLLVLALLGLGSLALGTGARLARVRRR